MWIGTNSVWQARAHRLGEAKFLFGKAVLITPDCINVKSGETARNHVALSRGFKQWQEGDGFVGVLAQPFTYSLPWNDLTGCLEYDPDASLEKQREFERKRDAFEEEYYKRIDGALLLAHLGCAIRLWLVVSGTERGNVWYDNRANLRGLRPLAGEKVERMRFCDWLPERPTAPLLGSRRALRVVVGSPGALDGRLNGRFGVIARLNDRSG